MQEILDNAHQQEENGNGKTANGKHAHKRQSISCGIPKNRLHGGEKLDNPIAKTSKNISNSSNHKLKHLILFYLKDHLLGTRAQKFPAQRPHSL